MSSLSSLLIEIVFVCSFQASPNDGLPDLVCIKCREQLDSCHRFRRTAHQSHQTLVDYLEFTSKLNGTPQVSFVNLLFLEKSLSQIKRSIDRQKYIKKTIILPAEIYESFVFTSYNANLFIMQFNCDM